VTIRIALAALAFLLAAVPARADVSESRGAEIKGWTADGAQVVWEEYVSYQSPDTASETFSCLTVAGADGRANHVYKEYQADFTEPVNEEPACWEKAEDEKAGKAWLAANKLAAPPSPAPATPDWKALLDAAGPESGGRPGKTDGAPKTLWSPDGSRLAVLWKLKDGARKLNVIPRRALAAVDLLDAGAGTQADAIAAGLLKAGFRVAHRGKAQQQRPTTMIYFAPGFEPEAREVAQLAGAAPEAVQPLSWKSPHAITVAAGPPSQAAGR
jgi:hypothetical protein